MRYLLVLAVCGLGIAFLASTGSAGTKGDEAPPAGSDSQKVGSVNQLVGGLEARLRDDPSDGKGWLLLAKSYEHLGRPDDAIAAYEKASALGVTDDQLLFRLMSSVAAWDARQ